MRIDTRQIDPSFNWSVLVNFIQQPFINIGKCHVSLYSVGMLSPYMNVFCDHCVLSVCRIIMFSLCSSRCQLIRTNRLQYVNLFSKENDNNLKKD